MTRTSPQGRTGQWGLEYVRSVVETGWGGIMQEFHGFRDVGVDATVMDMHKGHLTEYRFDLQVRTSEHYTQRPKDFAVTISREHRQRWAALSLPLFLVCVDAPPRGETKAFWRRITSSDAAGGTIFVSRQNVFGPTSRGQILAEVRRALPKELPAVKGEILGCPLNIGLRPTARDWYRRNLLRSPVQNLYFGPIHFTWHGWRHITRNTRSRSRIQSSLLLLPSMKAFLGDSMSPVATRRLEPIRRGIYDYHRMLLVFERKVTFTNRSPALVRVVVKQADILPQDWARRPPDAPDRVRTYAFYSIEELMGGEEGAAG